MSDDLDAAIETVGKFLPQQYGDYSHISVTPYDAIRTVTDAAIELRQVRTERDELRALLSQSLCYVENQCMDEEGELTAKINAALAAIAKPAIRHSRLLLGPHTDGEL